MACGLKTRCSIVIIIAFVFALSPQLVSAQKGDSYEADRKRALQLFDDHKMMDALPLLEKLATADPLDAVVLERLGFALVSKAATLKDESERKQVRIRARNALIRSKELGNDSNLLNVMLDGIPEDGSTENFSKRKDVDDAMRAGEAAFAQGNMDKAREAYHRALLLEPRLYEAPLFIGDTYFKQQQMDKAGEWFARATEIDPDRETAYRYWGDALMFSNKMAEARVKFIEAIVAEPYNRRSYMGLSQWAEKAKVQLGHPAIQIPDMVKSEGDNTTINIDTNLMDGKDGSQYWTMYAIVRAGYKASFSKNHPDEKQYRHTLKEEMTGLELVLTSVSKDMKDGKIKKVNPSIANLLKLREAGVLEAYILLARVDEGIARDYMPYRARNRDKIQRYLSEFVVSAAK